MTDVDSAVSDLTTTNRTTFKEWLAVIAVTLGIFSLVTAEQLPVGLLPYVSATLGVSDGRAGLMVTVPGIMAAIAAPLLPTLVGRMDRRWVLTGLMFVMTVANTLSALAPNYAVLLLSRVLVGVTIGGFWAIAGGLAPRLVPEHAVARAMSVIFGGVATALVVGVPAGTLISELAGWRSAFAVLAGLGLTITAILLFRLPPLPATHPVTVEALSRQIRHPGVRAGIIATLLVVTGHFAAYTFVSPILQRVAGIDIQQVSLLLLAYGIAGIGGNVVAGLAAGRNVQRTLLVIAALLTLSLAVFPAFGSVPAGGIALLILWGAVFGGVSVSVQTWVLKAAPQAAEASTALLACVFNLSIGLGALLGGVVVDTIALPGVLWFASVLFVLTTVTVWRAPRGALAGASSSPSQ